MDSQMEGLVGEDCENLITEAHEANHHRKPGKRLTIVVAALAAASLLVFGAGAIGYKSPPASASTASTDTGVIELADADADADADGDAGADSGGCDVSKCNGDKFCISKTRVQCCIDKGDDDTDTCCLTEGRKNFQVYTLKTCTDTCDTETPCKDIEDDKVDTCKALAKVQCCERGSNRLDCCARDSVPEDVKKGSYCRPDCDVEKACKGSSGKGAAKCREDALKKCEKKDKCTENIVGKGVSCLDTGCCKDPNLACYEKNTYWADCRYACMPGINKADSPDHQTPWSCRVLAGGNAPWEGCLASRQCRNVNGKKYACYAKNPHWAQCREVGNCKAGIHEEDPLPHRTKWACKVINASTGDLTWDGLGLEKPKDDNKGSD